jgi:hypothetical protein
MMPLPLPSDHATSLDNQVIEAFSRFDDQVTDLSESVHHEPIAQQKGLNPRLVIDNLDITIDDSCFQFHDNQMCVA